MAAEWEPASELEAALREALLAGNQEEYFRQLSDADLLLPVSAAAAAGEDQVTWYTGTDDEYVYVIAFTSPEAMVAGLGEAAEAYRRANLAELSVEWPDNDWWLAVNPGLPIESYLPHWYLMRVAAGEYQVPDPAAEDAGGSAVTTGTGDGVADGSTPAEGDRVAGSDLKPANYAERLLLEAAVAGDRDGYLKTMLLVDVLVPVPDDAAAAAKPGDPQFRWLTGHLDGEPCITLFTSEVRLAEHYQAESATPPQAAWSELVTVLRAWPDETWTLALNPGTDIGTRLSGQHVASLAAWAAEMGLADSDRHTDQDDEAAAAGEPATLPVLGTTMQKVIPANQVSFYLDRGYDRVAGFVHRMVDVVEFATPQQLYAALGLTQTGLPFSPDDTETHVIRWEARRADLYRRPFGGRSEEEMRAMDGWVIERPPFVGKGLAPSQNGAVIPEYKVDSVHLPHGAEMYRIDAEGAELLVAIYDADTRRWWRAAGEAGPEEEA